MSIKIKDCLFYSDKSLFRDIEKKANMILYNISELTPIAYNLKLFIKEYAERKNVCLKILYLPFNDDQVWGMFYKISGIFFIVINSEFPMNKQNVALAHEFYHFIDFLENHEDSTDDNLIDVLKDNPNEVECNINDKKANAFSSCFLMPKERVELVCKREPKTSKEKVFYIEKLMDSFMVPYKTAVIRAYELEKISEKELKIFLGIGKETIKLLDEVIIKLRFERWEQKCSNYYDLDDLDYLISENEEFQFISNSKANSTKLKVEEILKKITKKDSVE
ncbi:MAG: ImmA/IrrE family metallo-endopeptidase [Clostridia bacterium]|nr:ImmA/IrrE family metallo-endopeptidase [Clostridia bacterium]